MSLCLRLGRVAHLPLPTYNFSVLARVIVRFRPPFMSWYSSHRRYSRQDPHQHRQHDRRSASPRTSSTCTNHHNTLREYIVDNPYSRDHAYEDPINFAVDVGDYDDYEAFPYRKPHAFKSESLYDGYHDSGYREASSSQERIEDRPVDRCFYTKDEAAKLHLDGPGNHSQSLIRRDLTPPPPPSSPSPEYIQISKSPSTSLETHTSSSRKLLVLDLNGTLLFRTGAGRRTHQSETLLRTAHPRPYMPSFRQYLFCDETRKWLDVMIWSSAQPHSVQSMVERCFEDEKDEFIAIWARNTLGLSSMDYST